MYTGKETAKLNMLNGLSSLGHQKYSNTFIKKTMEIIIVEFFSVEQITNMINALDFFQDFGVYLKSHC